MPMIVSIFGVVGVRILWIYTAFRAVRTPFMLYISWPVSWVITLSVHLVCYLVARKKTFRLLRQMAAEREKAAPTETQEEQEVTQ